jgi:hypothetical protein
VSDKPIEKEYTRRQASFGRGVDKNLAALRNLWAVLGPKVPDCIACQGCSAEWSEALGILREALPIAGEEK